MKKKIHPKLVETTLTCSCGETYKVVSTITNLTTDICRKCHPAWSDVKDNTNARGDMISKYNEKMKRIENAQKKYKQSKK